MSALNYLVHHDVKMISVVIGPDSPVPDVVEVCDPMLCDSIRWVVQEEPTGVADAVKLANTSREHGAKRSMILCGDNVYPVESLKDMLDKCDEFVVCRQVEAWRSVHLTRAGWMQPDQRHEHAPREVLSRDQPGRLCLTTPWVFRNATLDDNLMRGDDIGHVINDLRAARRDIQSVLMLSKGWHDIGTPATYSHYWRSQ